MANYVVLAREMASDKLKVYDAHEMYIVKKDKIHPFNPASVRCFSKTQIYGRSKIDPADEKLYLYKYNIISMKESREEFEKLRAKGKLPRAPPLKLQVGFAVKELLSVFKKAEEKAAVKSAQAASKRKCPNLSMGKALLARSLEGAKPLEEEVVQVAEEENVEVSEGKKVEEAEGVNFEAKPCEEGTEVGNPMEEVFEKAVEEALADSFGSYYPKDVGGEGKNNGNQLSDNQEQEREQEQENLQNGKETDPNVTDKKSDGSDQQVSVMQDKCITNEQIFALLETLLEEVRTLSRKFDEFQKDAPKEAVKVKSEMESGETVLIGDGRSVPKKWLMRILATQEKLRFKVGLILEKVYFKEELQNLWLQLPSQSTSDAKLLPCEVIVGIVDAINTVCEELLDHKIAATQAEIRKKSKSLSAEELNSKVKRAELEIRGTYQIVTQKQIRPLISKILHHMKQPTRPTQPECSASQAPKRPAPEAPAGPEDIKRCNSDL